MKTRILIFLLFSSITFFSQQKNTKLIVEKNVQQREILLNQKIDKNAIKKYVSVGNGSYLIDKPNTKDFFITPNKKNKTVPSLSSSKMMATTNIDLNSVTAGNNHDFQLQPTTNGVFGTVISPIVTSDTNTIASASISISGVKDKVNQELFFVNHPSGTDIYYFNAPFETNDYTFSGSTIRVTQTTATIFNITEVSGNPIPNADFQEFLNLFLYGDLANPYTDGIRTMFVNITDTVGGTASATSTIRVYTTAPTVVDESKSVNANNTGTNTGNVLTNDSGASAITVTEVDGYSTAVGNVYTTLFGEINIQPNGTYSYNVNESNLQLIGLKNGENLKDIISYTVSDNLGIVDYGILTFTINGVNDIPSASNDVASVTAITETNTTGNLILGDATNPPDTFDRGLSTLVWENEFTQGATFGGFSDPISGESRTIDGVKLDFISTDASNIGIPNQNQVVNLSATNGGHTGYLGYAIDATTNNNATTTLTINFDTPVFNVGFILVDVDFSQGTAWQDQFQVSGNLSGSNSTYKFIKAGGIVDAGSGTFYGTGNALPSDATGNVNVLFTEPINQLTISYGYGPNATDANQGGQIAGISDMNWQGAVSGVSITKIGATNVATSGSTFTGMFGSLSVLPDGSYTYTPDTNNSSVSSLQTGQTLTDTFQYTLSDGTTNSNANLTVTINGSVSAFTWTGATDDNWDTATNWNPTGNPISTADITIPSGLTTYPLATNPISFNSLTMESGASFIAQNTVTGNVTYKRNLPTTNWYLVSPPVAGETFADFIGNTNFTLATGTGANIGLAPYDNNNANPWIYQAITSVGNFNAGKGYSVKLASANDISFTGTFNTSDVTVGITNGTNDDFNLLGNPFTSYVSSSTFASANTNELSEQTVWVWNGTSYEARNNLNAIDIAPAQGFFVEANTSPATGNVTFATTNQSHQATDTFLRGNQYANFELFVENDNVKKSTKVFYVENKTKGFDNGYDSSMFTGASTDFAIFTELLAQNEGEKIAIQTLPNVDLESMIIPVGLKAEAGKEITFSIETANLPEGILVYLEDRTNSKFIDLATATYKTTLSNDSDGVGQFYVHTSSRALSTDDFNQNTTNISIYKSSKRALTITGLQNKTDVTLYSLIGKEVFIKNISSTGKSTIDLPELSAGVYLCKLKSENGIVTKKIVLE